jgi:autotransporter-associated beta strand protein
MNNSAILALNNFSETVGFLSSNSPNTLVSLESGTLTLTGTTSTTYAGKIQGSGGIVLNQMAGTTWTWMSSFFSTYSGPTIVMNGNTLVAGNLDVFSPSSAVILQGSGTLLLNNNSQIIGPLSSTSSSSLVNLGSGILTVTGSLSSIFSGSILGTGGLTVDEALGTIFTLMGTSNTYSGTTTLQGGTLEAGAIGALSPSSSVVIERLLSGSVGILDLHDFDQSIPTLASVEASALVKLGSATLTLTGNHSTIYAGAITGTGGVTLNETDGAIFTVSGSNLNSYNGMTLLESGTLKANATNAFPFASFIEQDDATTLDLNGFDQDVQTLSSTSSTSKVLLGDGRLTLTSPISSTYAGMISGNTGGVTLAQSPGAIFTLVGMATYLGTTDVLGGTLRAGAMNVFPPNSSLVIGRLLSGSPGIVDLNDFDESAATLSSSDTGAQVLLGLATLTLTKNSSSSYGGSITGTGGLTLLGSSIFTLETSGISTYSGTTSVSNGTLRAGGNNAFSPHSSVFLSNGAVLDLHDHSETIPTLTSSDFTTKVLLGTGILTFTGTQSTTFDGAITGNGGIVLDETATFTLRGLNLYEGETVINSGVLAAGSNNTFSLLSPVEINNAGVLDLHDYFQSIDSLSSLSTGAMVFNGTSSLGTGILTLSGGRFNTAFTGVISGTGGLSKTGTSIFTLTNDNTYTGPTDISAGKIVVLGSLTSNVSVFSGGSLGGTGPFHGNVTIYAGGTDQPGDPTIQNIFGTYTQMAGSTLVIQITPTETDLVDVTGGPAVITGSTLKVTAARGTTYPQFMSYEIIRASGGVVGQFGSTVFSPLLLHPEVIYDAADVIIEFGFGLPVPSCITGNALSLLNYLNRENKIPHDSVQNILFDLEPVLTTCPLYLKALENLDPARYATLSLSSLELGLLFVNALDNRVMMNHARRSLRTKPSEIGLLSMTERTTIIPHGRVETAAADENSWDVWADGFDECIHGPEDSQNPAYNANLYGALLGVERLLKSGLVGFGAGYANGRIKEKQDFGLGKLQDVTGFFYGSAYVNNWYVDLGLFGAYLKINAERNFVLPLRNSTAESEHHAVQGTVHFATGYDFPTSWGTFEPFVLADWIWQCEGKVEESGTLFYNMHLRTRSFSELRSEAGLHYYQHWDRSWGMAILKETLAYVNKAPFGVGEIEAGLVGVPGIFLQNSYRDSQNLFRGGLQVFIQKGCDHYTSPFFSLSYDVEVGAGYLSNAVQGMLGFSF